MLHIAIAPDGSPHPIICEVLTSSCIVTGLIWLLVRKKPTLLNWSTKGDLLVHVTGKAGVDLASGITGSSLHAHISRGSQILAHLTLFAVGGLSSSRNFFFGCASWLVGF